MSYEGFFGIFVFYLVGCVAWYVNAVSRAQAIGSPLNQNAGAAFDNRDRFAESVRVIR
jgi:hypothetical protein